MMKKKPLDFGESREDKFMLPGIDFKAKMIGIEPVNEARGDKMCLDAMIKLKYLVKTSGEHKPRIVINVSIEGIRVLDEKTREVLHQHEVHRISFISRDPTDMRAFGYVYGEQGNHKFYGIKTEKQADALVLTLKELFEVVLDLKKQQIVEQKKAEQITEGSTPATNTEPKQIASFKNPPPLNGDSQAQNGADPVYAVVDKPKLSSLAAELNEVAPPSSGLLDLEQEVKNLQMGIDNMEEFDLHPQSPTMASPPPAASPDPFALSSPPAAAAAAPDPFSLSAPPSKPPQQQPAPAANLGAFGSTDMFNVEATPTAAVNSAPPSTAPSQDLFKEFSDTFTSPTPAPQPANAFQSMMGPSVPNPFGPPAATAPAPFQANFGGMGGVMGGPMPGSMPGGMPAAFGGAPAGFGAPPPSFGGPPAMQATQDPFGGSQPAFKDSVLLPESTPSPLDSTGAPKADPFGDLGALSSTKEMSNKDMFANYKIGKPGEPKPAAEIKLTGGPRRPPPAIPTSPQSSMCPALIPPPSSLSLNRPHVGQTEVVTMPSPQGPPPPLPPDTPIPAPNPTPSSHHPKTPSQLTSDPITPSAADRESKSDASLPLPANPPPPLPAYMNVNEIHASVPLREINLASDMPPPPPPPRARPSSQHLRLSKSNPLPVPPRNESHASQSSPPPSPFSETASVKSCDARFYSAPSPPVPQHRVPSPSVQSTSSALSTLDETPCEDHSSGITSNCAPSHSNSMNSLSSVFDSSNVSTDTFDNDSNAACSPSPSPIASSHETTSKPIDILPSHSSSAPLSQGPRTTSHDSLYSSVETLSSSSQIIHPSLSAHPSNHNHHHSSQSSTRASSHSSSQISQSSVFSTSAPASRSSFLSTGKPASLQLSPITLPNLPVHDDPFADDPFSRHSPSVKKTFVLDPLSEFSSSSTTITTIATGTTTNTSHAKDSANIWSSHDAITIVTKSDSSSDCVITSDPFAPGGAPVTNGASSGNDLFGNQFDTFDFSSPN